jgi:outer membrane protein assembly factor BamB
VSAVARILAPLSLAALLGGCGGLPSFGGDDEQLEPMPLADFEPSARVERLWSTSVGNGQGGKYNRIQPALERDRLYVAAANGVVMAVAADSGRRLWRNDLDADLSGGTGVGEGLVLVGTVDGEVVALDREDGAERWRRQLSGEILAPPAAGSDTVVVQTFDGHLYGLAAADGSELWRYDTAVPVLTLRGTAAPIVAEDLVFAAFANGKLVALDIENGGTIWETRVAAPQGQSEIGRIVDLDGTPLLLGASLYAVSYQGRLAAVDRVAGRLRWVAETSSFERVTEGLGNVYVVDVDGKIVAYDQASGAVRWQQDGMLRRELSAPHAFRSWLAVADYEGYVHFVSLLDGSFAARVRVDGDGVRAPMAARGDTLFVYGNSGALRAYRVTAR